MSRRSSSLWYHERGRPGKIEVVPTKPLATQRDLAMAYTPGVADACVAIAEDPSNAYRYTAKGNLVAVVTNGTAVLGLGNIGSLAGKPVMEGKANLFKKFADIDVFDIELDAPTVDEMVAAVKAIAPTFGGINLEDIRAPECFEVERRLRQDLDIPVFHDDQHGTAIICAAALLNALHLTERDVNDVRVVFSGAGAAAIACAELFISLGVQRSRVTMFDIDGCVDQGRSNMHPALSSLACANRFASMARFSPFLPLIGGGKTRFQPVYVGDVADAAVTCLAERDCSGRTFELGGPRAYSFEELMRVMLETIERRRLLISLPWGLAGFMGSIFQRMPNAPLTRDQVEQLKRDNVVSGELPGLRELDIEPHTVEIIIPTYLDRFRRTGRAAGHLSPGAS